ncbi:hypothetical protein MHBO_003730 [Bonamia ostreae]|uniref:Uncharacterized protein n=1 Tax=Bonamia ostreae TaxID=126728 RepID=A0ABV2ARB4_9EUKA
MIRDKIVFSTSGKIQQLLLRDDELDLRKAIKICQSYEQANKQVQEMKDNKDTKVHKIKTKQPRATKNPKPPAQRFRPRKPNEKHKPSIKRCKFCGQKHPMKKEECPAWGQKM